MRPGRTRVGQRTLNLVLILHSCTSSCVIVRLAWGRVLESTVNRFARSKKLSGPPAEDGGSQSARDAMNGTRPVICSDYPNRSHGTGRGNLNDELRRFGPTAVPVAGTLEHGPHRAGRCAESAT